MILTARRLPVGRVALLSTWHSMQGQCLQAHELRSPNTLPLDLRCRCEALPGCAQVGAVAGQRAAPQGTGAGAVT